MFLDRVFEYVKDAFNKHTLHIILKDWGHMFQNVITYVIGFNVTNLDEGHSGDALKILHIPTSVSSYFGLVLCLGWR